MRNVWGSAVSVLVLLLVAMCLGFASAKPAADSRRIVVLGDVHGDADQMRTALVMAKLVDNSTGAWIGGPQDKLVQMGDLVDRGAQDKEVVDEIRRLEKEAKAAGSGFVVLMGNHELMNIRRQVHYVNPAVYDKFGGRHEHEQAWSPNGELGQWVRNLPVAHVDMGTLFVHAGMLPKYAKRGIDALNAAARKEVEAGDSNPQMRGGHYDDVLGVHGLIWTRKLVHHAERGDCSLVSKTLATLGLDRMVVGHTPRQQGTIGDLCDSRLLDVDVGMSKWMYGNLAVLEMTLPGAGAEIELREILPHTKVMEEESGAEGGDGAASLAEELQRDPHRLQQIYDTLKQAESWNEGEKEAEGEKKRDEL